MIPTVDSSHTAEMLALLTEMFKKQPNIEGLLKSFGFVIQETEDAVWTFINGIILATAVGDVLDKYGSIVGVARDGLTDSDYRVAISVQIRVNKSSGTGEEIVQIASLVLSSFVYEEWYPAAFTIVSYNVTNPAALLRLLGKARSGGVRGVFLYTNWAPGSDLIWDSTTGHLSVAGGFQDLVSSQFKYKLVSSQDFTP